MGTAASVIIVNYQTPDLTLLAARSALADGADQVIVVDNASGDDSVPRLQAGADPRVSVIASARNGGFGSGANRGAAAASGDVLLFLNSDAQLRLGARDALVAEVGRHGGRALIGPRLFTTDGSIQRSAGLLPKPDDLIVRALGLHRVVGAVARTPGVRALIGRQSMVAEYEQAVATKGPIDVSMVSGACMAIGREAFESLGGFDERYFMYFEDADLCRRVTAAGWPIRYLPKAEVDHIGGASAPGDYRFGPLHGPSMVVYLKRWYGPPGGGLALLLLLARAIGFTVAIRPDAAGARTSLVEGVRAYPRGRSRSPRPASEPAP